MDPADLPAGVERRDPHNPLRRPGDYAPDGRRRRHWSRPERLFRLSYRRSPLATVACMIAILVGSSAAVAYGTTRVGSIFTDEAFAGSGWATCASPISWTTDTSALPPPLAAEIRPELAAAFSAWAAGSGYAFVDAGEMPVVYRDATSSVATLPEPQRNIAVTFVPDAQSTMLTRTVVGFASPNRVWADTREIVGGYMVLSSDYVGTADARHRQALFMHELGHALGLTDSLDPRNVMFGYLDTNATLASGDIAGIRAIEKVCVH